MKKQKKIVRRGSALVVAILLSAIIGSAAIGFTAIAFRQVNIAETYNNGLAAYYAAESGLEQGLLYYKYDKNIEIPKDVGTNVYLPDPAHLLRRPALAYRNFSDQTPMQKPINDTGVSLGYNGSDRIQVYDLQMYFKQAYTGADTSGDGIVNGIDLANSSYGTYKIAKDNTMVFSINSDPSDKTVNEIHLYWKWITPSCNGLPRALEVKIKVTDPQPTAENEYSALFRDPRCPAIANSITPDAIAGSTGVFTPQNNISLQAKMNISSFTAVEMSLKPVGNTAASGDGIYYGFSQGPIGQGGKRISSGLSTTIQSVGYFAGNSRQITANIDRQTGTILDIFNYVIYKGQ